jgi:hypothetical protein
MAINDNCHLRAICHPLAGPLHNVRDGIPNWQVYTFDNKNQRAMYWKISALTRSLDPRRMALRQDRIE